MSKIIGSVPALCFTIQYCGENIIDLQEKLQHYIKSRLKKLIVLQKSALKKYISLYILIYIQRYILRE